MLMRFGSRTLDLTRRIGVVGIMNLTPDSFVPESRVAPGDVLSIARRYIDDGADILEVGGESTGPGSPDVSLEEERSRVVESVRSLRSAFPDMWIAVDTWKAAIARESLAAGADIINDITAGRGDPAMFSVIAGAACPYILMYSKDPTARTTVQARQYDDVVKTVRTFLTSRIAAAVDAGIPWQQIIIDPGLGHFVSSEPQYSYKIIDHLEVLADLGPVLVSPARKSFLAGPQNHPPSRRLEATLFATKVAALNGTSLVRTHDVKETVELLRSLDL